jgi:class 3 adenylate cyclase
MILADFIDLGALLTGERVERRLAAVLAADVAGYSRLMGANEEGTLARLKAVRKTLSTQSLPLTAVGSSRLPVTACWSNLPVL